MPYPSEHAARLRNPADFDPQSFRRVNGKFGAGVDVIFGKLKGGSGSLVIQTIRFDAAKFTPEQARAWLKDHKYTASLEPASGKPSRPQTSQKEAPTKSEPDGPHPSTHYLVVEDPSKPTTWHLRFRDKAGKIDRGLLGAAWAALHKGFRGNVYSGPGKQEAIGRLTKLYHDEGLKTPTESQAAQKELTVAIALKVGAPFHTISLKHLPGQHSQKRHGWRFSGAQAKPAEGADAEVYAAHAARRQGAGDKQSASAMRQMQSDKGLPYKDAHGNPVTAHLHDNGDSTYQLRILDANGKKLSSRSVDLNEAQNFARSATNPAEIAKVNAAFAKTSSAGSASATTPAKDMSKFGGGYSEASRILSRTPAQRRAEIKYMATFPLAKLRKYQDLNAKQLKLAARQGNDLAVRSLQARERDYAAAIDLREFGAKEFISTQKELTADIAVRVAAPFLRYAPLQASAFTITTTKEGAPRWTLLSSSAFRDRDGEIVSTKALQIDVDRADHDHDYGPLRWWHVPGLDIGDCDFNMLHKHILIESGTFRSPEIADTVKEHADGLEASIGFVHPSIEPDRDGVYHRIRRFERSLVPKGRVSSRTTRLIL